MSQKNEKKIRKRLNKDARQSIVEVLASACGLDLYRRWIIATNIIMKTHAIIRPSEFQIWWRRVFVGFMVAWWFIWPIITLIIWIKSL